MRYMLFLTMLVTVFFAKSACANDDAAEKEKLAKEWLKYMEGEWDVRVCKRPSFAPRQDISPPNLQASAKLKDNRLVVKFTSPLPSGSERFTYYGSGRARRTVMQFLQSSSTIVICWEPNLERLTFDRLGKGTAAGEYSRDSVDLVDSSQVRHRWVFSEIEADEVANTKKIRAKDWTKTAVRKTKAGFVCTHEFWNWGGCFLYELAFTRKTEETASPKRKATPAPNSNPLQSP